MLYIEWVKKMEKYSNGFQLNNIIHTVESIPAFYSEIYVCVVILLSYFYLPQTSAPFCSDSCDSYPRVWLTVALNRERL